MDYYSAHCRDPGTCDLLAEKLRAGETRVVLPGLFRSVRETQAVVRAVMLDHPELFWVNYYRYSVIDTLLGQYLMLATFFSPAEQEELRCQAEAWRGRVLAQLPAAVDAERLLRLLADYLARQVEYRESGPAFSHTIVGVFQAGRHAAVCEGIAKGMKYLCDGAGLPCLVVAGTVRGQAHAWNIVRIPRGYRHLDVTCQLNAARNLGNITGKKLFYQDSELTDRVWDHGKLPHCN